jgi:hypothetical protein
MTVIKRVSTLGASSISGVDIYTNSITYIKEGYLPIAALSSKTIAAAL